MNSSSNKPVVLIMAGGKGERFWPKSRISTPKQLQKVYSNKTLLRETIDRAATVTSLDRIYIGTNATLKKEILKTEKSFPEKNFIIEPEGKNTGPIVALASLFFQQKYGNPVQIVLSADAFIETVKEFTTTIVQAVKEAEKSLVLLGVKPDRPEVGYGYIASGKPTEFGFQVKGFFEKPDLKTAAKYIKKENFFWNPGIFIWKTETILSEFSKYAPYILNPLKSAFPFKNPGELGQVFKVIPSEAIDTAIIEKSNLIRMVRAGFKWDDVGSWLSLARVLPGDNQGNHHIGKGVYYYKSKNNISVTGKEMVTFLGVEDLIVVEEEDVLFISTRSKVGEIKTFLGELRKNRSLQKYLE